MKQLLLTSALVLCCSMFCLAQYPKKTIYSEGETAYPMANLMRLQMLKERQKYSNMPFNENAQVLIFLDDEYVPLDSLYSVPLSDVEYIKVDYNSDRDKDGFGAIIYMGVIEIKTQKEEEQH